jgi:hypothetical protein
MSFRTISARNAAKGFRSTARNAAKAFRSTARTTTVLIAAVATVVTLQAADTSRPQAETFAKKIAIINQHAERDAQAARRTTLTESELNSWFAFRAQPLLPPGLTQPKVTIVGNGKLMGSATVDLEAIGKQRGSGGSLDVWSYLGGRLPLNVTGVLHTKEGQGRFELQAADISGVPVPKTLLQELLSYYTRTSEKPQGVRLDDPFALPSNIKQIDVGQGQAIVVQ